MDSVLGALPARRVWRTLLHMDRTLDRSMALPCRGCRNQHNPSEGAGVTGLGFGTQRSLTDAETFFAIGGRRLGTSQLAPPPVPARSQAWRSLAFKLSRHPSGTVLLTIPLGSACEHGQIGQIAPSQIAFVYDPSDHWQQYGRNH